MASLRDTAAWIGIAVTSPSQRFLRLSRAAAGSSVLTRQPFAGAPGHMNLIRVGVESFKPDDETEIDAAVQFTRDTYAQVDLGVGRVLRFFITTADANGRDNMAAPARPRT